MNKNIKKKQVISNNKTPELAQNYSDQVVTAEDWDNSLKENLYDGNQNFEQILGINDTNGIHFSTKIDRILLFLI